MKVIYGSWCGRHTFDCGRDQATSGYDNIPMFLDGKWHNLDDAECIEADLVLAATPPISLFHKVKKSECWNKLVMMQESGVDMLNCIPFLEEIMKAPVDGYLLHNRVLTGMYDVLGKPVYHFDHPYFWEKAEAQNVHPKEPNTVFVNLSRFGVPHGNPVLALAVMKRMPHVRFAAHFHDVERFSRWAANVGVTNMTCFPPVNWYDCMRESSRYSAFFSPDDRVTIGRFCFDAAAMNVPCVGVYSEAQEHLFPEFMVDRCDVTGAVQKLNQALSHGGQYPVSSEKKQFFGLERFGVEFKKLCERMASG